MAASDFFERTGLREMMSAGDPAMGSASSAFAAPAAVHAAATQEEVDALIAVIPSACRANARWAVPLLLETARNGGITHPRRIAYLLATAQHAANFGGQLEERGTGPVRDGVDRSFDSFEPGTRLGAALGNTQAGDGERFRGRGFIRIKGRSAYAAWSQRLGLPDQLVDDTPLPYFVAHPGAMARPQIAAQTLVRGMRDGLFTGCALGYYVNDKKTDYYSARRVVAGPQHAREVADIAAAFAEAIEDVQTDRHRARMHKLSLAHAGHPAERHIVQHLREAVERLAARGEHMPHPLEIVEWNGEARQGKFVQMNETTCALHTGRGTYVRLDIQRDLNGIVPPEGRNMALKRSGDVRPAARHGEVNSWR